MFTAFPVMWFAVYDMQYEASRLLKEPALYKIGLRNECFSTKVFFSHVLSAIANGFVLCVIIFYGNGGTKVNGTAKNGYYWVDGTLIYAAIVLIVNVTIFYRTNNHSVVSVALVILSIASFWLCFWVENLFDIFGIFYGLFDDVVYSYNTYLVLTFCLWFNLAQHMIFYNFSKL